MTILSKNLSNQWHVSHQFLGCMETQSTREKVKIFGEIKQYYSDIVFTPTNITNDNSDTKSMKSYVTLQFFGCMNTQSCNKFSATRFELSGGDAMNLEGIKP